MKINKIFIPQKLSTSFFQILFYCLAYTHTLKGHESEWQHWKWNKGNPLVDWLDQQKPILMQEKMRINIFSNLVCEIPQTYKIQLHVITIFLYIYYCFYGVLWLSSVFRGHLHGFLDGVYTILVYALSIVYLKLFVIWIYIRLMCNK